MKRDWVRHHGEDVHDDLLEEIEFVEIHRVQTCLGVGATGEKERVNIGHIILATSIDEDRSDDSTADDPDICMSQSVRIQMKMSKRIGSGGVTRTVSRDEIEVRLLGG